MLNNKISKIASIILFLFFLTTASYGGGPLNVNYYQSIDSDSSETVILISYFDLREREAFIQLTNTPDTNIVHVRIFNVADNCNENNFFDEFTPADTHVYNMRDIQTNDGNPSGVVLPDDAYGYVVFEATEREIFGNLRILDDSGYEYRTNLVFARDNSIDNIGQSPPIFFNFNKNEDVKLSDILIINFPINQSNKFDASGILNSWFQFDVDIIDENETLFSCRDVVSACVDNDNPLLDALLELTGTGVASFDYGINNAIPHSRDGELLCPGNIIEEGLVSLRVESSPFNINLNVGVQELFGFVGLNNGNDRGSFDSWWATNLCLTPSFMCE